MGLRRALPACWAGIRELSLGQSELEVVGTGSDWEGAVKMSRFRIAWIMVAVAFIALDCLAIRAFLDSPSPMGEELLLGALPMTNVLAIGLLIARQRPGTRPFILGFVTFGAVALAIYAWLADRGFPNDLPTLYVKPFVNLAERNIGRGHTYLFIPIVCFGIVAMNALPQLAFALIGGFLSRKYKVTVRITRR